MKTKLITVTLFILALGPAFAEEKKPNILVIMGDDIGWYNPSIYHRGDMGYWTPNIDRIGKEGAMFTCWLRTAELHGRTRGLHNGTVADSYRPNESRSAR